MTLDKIDSIAILGYEYASGNGIVPKLKNQFEIDCFNAGISNFNIKHNTFVPYIKEDMKSTFIEGSNNGLADKELAIVGP